MRKTASKRGWLIAVFLAGGAGYLLGDWHASRGAGVMLSPAQFVALRFPEDQAAPPPSGDAQSAPATITGASGATGVMVLGNTQLALLSPEPMVPQSRAELEPLEPQESQEQPEPKGVSLPQLPAPTSAPSPAAMGVTRPVRARAAVPHPAAEAKAPESSAQRLGERPGFMLNDAQIASIRRRLHLTPDQERMWPAVEAALRNIAYARTREARRHGASVMSFASLDPYGSEVQGLKSAAFPLIMSFNSEQRNEVRSLAHVMGLDRLASEF